MRAPASNELACPKRCSRAISASLSTGNIWSCRGCCFGRLAGAGIDRHSWQVIEPVACPRLPEVRNLPSESIRRDKGRIRLRFQTCANSCGRSMHPVPLGVVNQRMVSASVLAALALTDRLKSVASPSSENRRRTERCRYCRRRRRRGWRSRCLRRRKEPCLPLAPYLEHLSAGSSSAVALGGIAVAILRPAR